MKKYFIRPILSLIVAVNVFSADGREGLDEVLEVSKRLSGIFDSSRQASTNPSYVVVKLQACAAVVEPENTYLYVEQTATEFSNKPYRQRIYRISWDETSKTVESRIFKIMNQDSLVGACDQNRKPMILPDDLVDIECAVNLKQDGNLFVGSTPQGGCRSNFGGASTSTSQVTLEENLIRAWDRGYDKNGNQVWGPNEGPYEFQRVE